jgi:hypothetical protein
VSLINKGYNLHLIGSLVIRIQHESVGLESRGGRNLHLALVHPVGIPRLVSMMEGYWTGSERGGGGGGTGRKDEQGNVDDESGGRTILESTNDIILFALLS